MALAWLCLIFFCGFYTFTTTTDWFIGHFSLKLGLRVAALIMIGAKRLYSREPPWCQPGEGTSSILIVCLFTYISSLLSLSLTFFLPYTFFITYLLAYWFTSWLICAFHNRPIPFPGQRSYEATKPGFSFIVFILCCSIFRYGCVFAFVFQY